MSFSFAKMQGAGNDFVVVRGEERDWSALAPAVCARRFGGGSDGILVALPSEAADVRMRMYNPDGTEDECGNGLRCLALYALSEGLVDSADFRVETLSGVKAVAVQPTFPAENGSANWMQASVTADMGAPQLKPAAIPALVDGDDALGIRIGVGGETVEACALSTGTAHTVVFASVSEERFQRLSPLLEHHPLFPERTSIMWSDQTGPDRFRIRIWERGAGETLACGTGACAVAASAFLTGRAGRRVEVESRGGVLVVEIAADLSLRMTGPAAYSYRGVYEA
ncbi:MAG: diaminopimelate epimerase [Actinomycetota bacterium]